MSEREVFRREYLDHLETWGPNCGAPLSVYQGHLDKLLATHRQSILEEEEPNDGRADYRDE